MYVQCTLNSAATSPKKHCTAMLSPRSVVTQEAPPGEQEVGVASSCRGKVQWGRCRGGRCRGQGALGLGVCTLYTVQGNRLKVHWYLEISGHVQMC